MTSCGGASGVSTQHLRDAQDYTLRLKRRLISTGYQQNLLNHTPNSNGNYLSALLGARECVLPLLSLSPSAISQNEGSLGTTSYTYTVTRIGSADCAVSWAVTGSGASPAVASDFAGSTLPQGVVYFATGDVTKSVVVQVVGDVTVESNKQFTVTLSNPIGATIGVGTATGTITNDDFPVLNLSPASITLAEGNSGTTPYTYTVARTGALACSVSWAVTGSGGTPATAGDFSGSVLPSGTLSFLIGDDTKTITINVAGDATVEGTKQFTVTLSSPVNATIGTGTAIGIITNDDP